MVGAVLIAGCASSEGCYIHGADIGYCETALYDDSEFRCVRLLHQLGVVQNVQQAPKGQGIVAA